MRCLKNDETRNLTFTVGALQDDFDRISRGIDVAFNTSGVLHRLDIAAATSNAPRISEDQRDHLTEALVLAHASILALFTDPTERALAANGIEAAAGLIFLWAESGQQRAARHPHVRADLVAYARWLRNACHNLCLLTEVEGRARDRRHTETVTEMLRRSCA